MTTDTLSTFFALLMFVCIAATLATIVVVVGAHRRARGGPIGGLADGIGELALWLAWLVATVTTVGSLYYSLGANFEPCEFCWYQRICVYPLSVILLIAAVRRDRDVWRYALPLAVIGMALGVYHTQLQAFPDQGSSCPLTNPCTLRHVWEFGFVSLPMMNLAACTFIATMLAVAARHQPSSEEPASPTTPIEVPT